VFSIIERKSSKELFEEVLEDLLDGGIDDVSEKRSSSLSDRWLKDMVLQFYFVRF
jgi:hypothetical protein